MLWVPPPGKRGAVATPSPLSQWGQFPIFFLLKQDFPAPGGPREIAPHRVGECLHDLSLMQPMLPTTGEPLIPNVSIQQALVIRVPDAFILHVPDTLTDPPVQLIKLPQISFYD